MNDEKKHSPGPWRPIFDLKGGPYKRGVRNDHGFICFLTTPTHYNNQDERYTEEMAEKVADTRLIAAAPELLEALEKIRDNQVEWYEQWEKMMEEIIEPAIKKAKGEIL